MAGTTAEQTHGAVPFESSFGGSAADRSVSPEAFEGGVLAVDSLVPFGGYVSKCEGFNKSKGARCTNDSRKGSRFCFGHRNSESQT